VALANAPIAKSYPGDSMSKHKKHHSSTRVDLKKHEMRYRASGSSHSRLYRWNDIYGDGYLYERKWSRVSSSKGLVKLDEDKKDDYRRIQKLDKALEHEQTRIRRHEEKEYQRKEQEKERLQKVVLADEEARNPPPTDDEQSASADEGSPKRGKCSC
jgi:hypothetical protein